MRRLDSHPMYYCTSHVPVASYYTASIMCDRFSKRTKLLDLPRKVIRHMPTNGSLFETYVCYPSPSRLG